MPDDDKKLPAIRRDSVPANAHDQEPSRMTTFGRFIRGQLARVDEKSLKRTKGAVDAYTDYEIAKGNLADAKTATDRKIARYRDDRDKLIADDRDQTDHELELNKDRRARERAAAQADTERARDQAARAKHDREFTEELSPKKKQRGADLFEAGNYDALGKMRLAEAAYNRKWGNTDQERPDDFAPSSDLAVAIATVEDQIAKAESRGEDASQLYIALGRLKAQAKKQPG